MQKRTSVTTLMVCVVAMMMMMMMMMAVVLIAVFQLCYHPSEASEATEGVRPVPLPDARAEKRIREHRTVSRVDVERPVPAVQSPTPSDSLLSPELFDTLCREFAKDVRGTVTVAYGHEDASYYYPSYEEASLPRRAASVGKPLLAAGLFAARPNTARGVNKQEIELCRRAISISDNDAANKVMDLVGIERANSYVSAWGYTSTKYLRHYNSPAPAGGFTDFNQTSAADQLQFLRDIWQGRILTNNEREMLLKWMRHGERRSKIPRFFGKDYEVYNKTGETSQPLVENDVAIVARGKEVWYLAILTSDATETDEVVRAGIARLARDLITSFNE